MERNTIDEPAYKLAYKFRRILVPIAPTERSLNSIEVARDFYHRYGSKIVFFYVSQAGEDEDRVREFLSKYANDIPYELKIEKLKNNETIASMIINEINNEFYDLIIVESRGLTGAQALLYNSISAVIALTAPTSVLILR